MSLLNYTLACSLHLRSTENLCRCSYLVRNYSLRRLGCLLRCSLGWPAEHHFTTDTRVDLITPPSVGTRAIHHRTDELLVKQRAVSDGKAASPVKKEAMQAQ
jgi:hypothetical protein